MVMRKLISDRISWTGGNNPCSTGPVLLLDFFWYNACIILKEKSLYAVFYVQTSGLQIIIVMQVDIDSVCKNKILG